MRYLLLILLLFIPSNSKAQVYSQGGIYINGNFIITSGYLQDDSGHNLYDDSGNLLRQF